jgi:hypothetical protein
MNKLDAIARNGVRLPTALKSDANLPDASCSAPCYSIRRRIKQPPELFALCRPEKAENEAQSADLPVFLPVSRERPCRRLVRQDCLHRQTLVKLLD